MKEGGVGGGGGGGEDERGGGESEVPAYHGADGRAA